MKFSQVFVVLSVLFAISFGVPANWKENEDLMASNDNAVEEKRFVFTTWAAKKALGLALRAACKSGKLSGKIKGACICASMLGRDEESEAEKRWLFSSNVVKKLKSKVKSICNGRFGKFLGGPCGCITPFL
ncbi:Hypothetical predicted protein [Paramuricea clavata]|uniref:Uncharacterized protein n=1 Tax=Paramuricea clavata TaxID=317549 RepID=A0A6S7G830_PARCT|nr:Hypothetical predicted protein [Paramuricea clavata]